MKTKAILTAGLVVALSLLSLPVLAKTLTVEADGQYIFGEIPNESLDSAKERAREYAKRRAVEQAGVYLEAYTKTQNFQLTSDELNLISSRVMKIHKEEFSVEPLPGNAAIIIKCNIVADVNTDEVNIKQIMKDKKAVQEGIELQHNIEQLEKTNHQLRLALNRTASEAEKTQLATKLKLNENQITAAQYVWRGMHLRASKQDTEALELFDKAIALDPENKNAYRFRALIYIRQNKLEEAYADAQKALKLDGRDGDSYYVRGLVAAAMKKNLIAEMDFSTALRFNPQSEHAYLERGKIYLSLNDYSKALADFNKALELDPQYANAYQHRGTVYYFLKQPALAVADFDKTLELDPTIATAYFARSGAYVSLGNKEQAIKDLDKAIELDPNFSQAMEIRKLLSK